MAKSARIQEKRSDTCPPTTHRLEGTRCVHLTDPFRAPFELISFQHLRPVDLRKDFRTKRPRPRRLREGPGRKDALLTDPFLRFNIDPRHECENAELMSEYVSELGKILPRSQTRLSHRTQRLLTKAIKRSKLMGIIPTHSRLQRTRY